MDSNIRTLLKAAGQGPANANDYLNEAFSLLKNYAETRANVDAPASFNSDLYVLCGETAFQSGKREISKECLKMYFMNTPPTNQFLCRAYLCQAQLLAPDSANDPEQLERAVVYLLKAINFAKENPRYHFLVYNASVLYWQFCRPFLKAGYRQYLSTSLHHVVKALDDIDDSDYEWRAQLVIALIECHMDAGRHTEAAAIATVAHSLIRHHVPDYYKQLFGLMARYNLIDPQKFTKEIKANPDLAIFYKICKLKQSIEIKDPDLKDIPNELNRILYHIVSGEEMKPPEPKKRVGATTPVTPGSKEKSDLDSASMIVDASVDSPVPVSEPDLDIIRSTTHFNDDFHFSDVSIDTTVQPVILVDTDVFYDLQNSQDGKVRKRKIIIAEPFPPAAKLDKNNRERPIPSPTSSLSSTPSSTCTTDSSSTPFPSPAPITKSSDTDLHPNAIHNTKRKPKLLLELGRMCLDQNLADLAKQCIDAIKDSVVSDKGFYIEVEFLQAHLMVIDLKNKQESYQKSIVDIRLAAIKRCEDALLNAIRLGDPNIIQAGCVTQWNLCLPLLQTGLRKYVRKPLTVVADALKDIESLLIMLRCQVHTELAKCEEDQEQIQVAMEHLKMALLLDDGAVYRERLETSLKRLELRAELYKQPERPEDQAAMIIEQVRKQVEQARKSNSGTIRMKRSLLVRAGQALSEDAFLLVLDSENDTKAGGAAGKGPLTIFKKLAGKAKQYNKCVSKAEGHLKRLGDENDRERAALWADLAKVARKQEVWDVCRVAARFTLLYDDGRWNNPLPPVPESPRKKKLPPPPPLAESPDGTIQEESELSSPKLSSRQTTKELITSRATTPVYRVASHFEKDLMRMLAEVNFIQGEAIVHLLRSEGVQLGDSPVPPEDKSKHPKGYVAKKPSENPDWLDYCDWIQSLSILATKSFLRASELGVELQEPWIVCCAATYFWNYNNHILSQNRHPEIVDTLSELLEALKKVGHVGETSMLVNICTALAFGLLKPWLPRESKGEKKDKSVAEKSPPRTPKGKKPTPSSQQKIKSASQVEVSADAQPDLKRALECLLYAMDVTNGDNVEDVVPIAVRHPLLQTWVLTKQMLQQQINKTLGVADGDGKEGQTAMTRALVAVEMLQLSPNGMMEFKDGPGLSEVVSMVEACVWSDHLIELQVWTRLTYLAYKMKEHNFVIKTSGKALEFAENGTQPKNRPPDTHKHKVEQEMLSYSSCLLGQSYMENMSGKNALRRQAMEAFFDSIRFGAEAENYQLVINAVRHYWNACMVLVNQPIERELLKEPLRVILDCITDTDAKQQKMSDSQKPPLPPKSAVEDVTGSVVPKVETGDKQRDEDLTLRAALYGVLFQSYADKGEWEKGIEAMDEAVNCMPRTSHRLLLFKHRVMVKAKLGRDVQMDIQKFKDENEDYVANMWRRVAMCSRDKQAQLTAYKNSIESLTEPANDWQKFDNLIEFSQWLYCNDFPLVEVTDLLQWAIDILLNMEIKEEESAEKPASAKSVKKKKSKKDSLSAGKSTSSLQDISKKSPSMDEIKEPIETARTTSDNGSAEINAADFIPVEKKAVIGVLPKYPDISIDDLTDIRQLEGLFRAYVLLSQISGRDCEQTSGHQYKLMAYGIIVRIWHVSLSAAGPVMKEIAKNPAVETPNKKAISSAAKKAPKKDKDEPAKEKPKRKGPVDAVPGDIEEWSVYDAPDEVLEAFKHESMKFHGVNVQTITKPTLTYYYLEVLTQMLRDVGYNHLTLPVLAFSELMSRGLIKCLPLNSYIHFSSAQVCTELNLSDGANFHFNLAGSLYINDEEQAKSRVEMAMWKEKLLQVAKEELRVKESLMKIQAELKSTKKTPSKTVSKLTKTALPENQEKEEDPSSLHMGKKLGNIVTGEVWADTAQLFIKQGYYQPARQILEEAQKMADSFGNKPLSGRILYCFGLLSFHEAQYGQAINFCKEAQSTHDGDEMFWYQTEELIIESLVHNYDLKDRLKQARNHLDYALNIFLQISAKRPNKTAITGYILAMLESKFAMLQNELAKDRYEHDLIRLGKAKQSMLSASKKFESCKEDLLTLGYRREPIKFLKNQANIYHYLAKESSDRDEKHGFYLDALKIMLEANSFADNVYEEILVASPSLNETVNVSLPVQREAADVKLGLAELMVDMFALYAQEQHNNHLNEQRKSSVVKMVEEIIDQTPDYSVVEKQWVETMPNLMDTALSLLANAHCLVINIPNLKAKCLYNIGRCLHLVSVHVNPDAPSVWDINSLELLSIEGMIATEGGEEEYVEEDDPNSKIFIRGSKLIRILTESATLSNHFLAQATECLFQSIHLSLQHGYTDVCAATSLELVECCGQYDPSLTASMLALYQSCQISQKMEDALHRALLNPTTSAVAALLMQRKRLLENDVTTNFSASHLMKDIEKMLMESEAWKRLKVLPNHFDLMKEFPSNFNFVVLQHSPDRSYLYGAVLEKAKSSSKEGGKGRHAAMQVPSKTKVVRIKTSKEESENYLALLRQYKSNVQQLLLKQEYKQSQLALRQKMLANLEKGEENKEQTPIYTEAQEEEEQLQVEFRNLVDSLDCQLKPLLVHIESVYRPTTSTSISNATQAKDTTPVGEAVILLVDYWLLETPLEALQTLQYYTINSLTRDFSLQFFYHRFYFEQEDPAEKKAKEKTKPPSRIPGLRDAGMKKAKIIPLDRQVPAGCFPVDTTHFRYFVDPHLDCAETETHSPIEIFEKSVLEKHEQKFTARWLGILGNDHVPSVGEYEIYMNESTAVLYYGMERFLSEISPEKFTALNLPNCMIVGLYDLAQTSKSFLRQSKVDILKNPAVMNLEKPLETVLLLSLTGIRCIFTNQWHCTLEDNGKKMDETMQDLLAGGLTTGQSIRLQHTPYRRPKEPTEQPVNGEEIIEEKIEAEEEESQEGTIDRKWFNLVCYGLPNIMVTLLSN